MRMPMMNALVLTSVRNSDWAIVRMRLIRPPPRPSCSSSAVGLAMRTKMSCSDGFVISNCSTGVRCDEPLQERLRVARQPHVLEVAVVVDRLDAGQAGERRGRRPSAHADGVVPVLRLDLVERSVEHLVALEDHEDAIAQLLGRAHVVRREHDRRALAPQLEHGVAQRLGVHRIQAGERLVQDQQLRLRHDGGDELDLLRHALRELIDALVGPRR